MRYLEAALLVVAISVLVSLMRPSTPRLDMLGHLSRADSVELLSLDPTELSLRQYESPTGDHAQRPAVAAENAFRDHEVLGRVTLTGEEKRALEAELMRVIRASNKNIGSCFQPRHGVRFTTDNGQCDLLICFRCSQIFVYETNAHMGRMIPISGNSAIFNAILTRHHIVLPWN